MTTADWTLDCECGYVATGTDDAALVADAQRHARTVHGMEMTTELLLGRLQATRPQQGEPGRTPR
jgi:predicted small metal-binding protein